MKKIWVVVVGVTLLAFGSLAQADTKKSPPEVPSKVEITGRVDVSDVTQRPADPTQQPCDPPQNVRSSDLCAQWKAADAARDSATWSMVSAIVSTVTLFAIGFGFWQTQDTQQREYRAYLKPVIKGIEADDKSVGVLATVENYGRTPAFDLHGSYKVEIGTIFPEEPTWLLYDMPVSFSALHPGKPEVLNGAIPMIVDPSKMKKLIEEQCTALVTIELNYRDVFRKMRSASLKRRFAVLQRRDEKHIRFVPLP